MKKGFTIAELLIGLALISIIALVGLKFFDVIGGGAKQLDQRQINTIKNQMNSEFLLHNLSNAGLAGDSKNFFMLCPGASAQPCSATQFAIRTSEHSGFIEDTGTGKVRPS